MRTGMRNGKAASVAARAVWVVLVFVFLAGAAGAQQAPSDSADEGVRAEISRVLEEYAGRIKAKDAVGIAELYSYPYKTVHPDGEAKVFATKEEVIAFHQAEQAAIGAFERVEVAVRELSQSGDAAVAKADTFVTVVIEGQPMTFISQVEFRFVRSGDRWLISEEWTLAMDVSEG